MTENTIASVQYYDPLEINSPTHCGHCGFLAFEYRDSHIIINFTSSPLAPPKSECGSKSAWQLLIGIVLCEKISVGTTIHSFLVTPLPLNWIVLLWTAQTICESENTIGIYNIYSTSSSSSSSLPLDKSNLHATPFAFDDLICLFTRRRLSVSLWIYTSPLWSISPSASAFSKPFTNPLPLIHLSISNQQQSNSEVELFPRSSDSCMQWLWNHNSNFSTRSFIHLLHSTEPQSPSAANHNILRLRIILLLFQRTTRRTCIVVKESYSLAAGCFCPENPYLPVIVFIPWNVHFSAPPLPHWTEPNFSSPLLPIAKYEIRSLRIFQS